MVTKYEYKSGEVLPAVGSAEYKLAQSDPESLRNFKTANPALSFTDQDMTAYNNANPISPTMSADDLKTNPSLISISPTPTSTSAVGLSSEISSRMKSDIETQTALDTEKAKRAEIVAEQKTAFQKAKDSLLGFMGGTKGKTAVTDEAYSTTNELGTTVDETSKKLKDINAKINAVDIRTNEEIKALEASHGGMLESGFNATRNNIIKRGATEKADLYIEKLFAQGDYDSAKEIADRKVDMILEEDKMTLDKLQFDYNENKELFTKEEQRQFETDQKERDRAYEDRKTELKNVQELAIDAKRNGAPDSVVSLMLKSGNVQEAMGYGGQYIGALDRSYKQAQLNKLNAEIKDMGLGGITNPEAGQYSGALNVILGSGKFTKDQKTSVINSINNGEDPFIVIKNQAKNIMGQTLATNLDKYETAKTQMESIQTMLDNYYANGGSTNIFKGKYERVVNKLGEVSDPALVEIATNIASALQIYRNAVSGTAYSVQEGKDIESIFPGINKSEGLNEAVLKGRLKAFDTTIDSSYRNTLGKAYDELKSANEVPINEEEQLRKAGYSDEQIEQIKQAK